MSQRKRGGNFKIAPEGYYTARDASYLLATSQMTLSTYVERGEITRFTPPGKRNSFYEQAPVDAFAQKLQASALDLLRKSAHPQPIKCSWAQRLDLPGITDVLASFGWPSPSISQRQTWLEKNPYIYYMVKHKNLVLGYISLMAHPMEIIDDLLAGRTRAKDLWPRHILTFEPGQQYDAYFGAAVRAVPFQRHYAGLVLKHFFEDLGKLAQDGHIVIRRLYGMTDEDDGRRLGRTLGFTRLPAEPGDVFGERHVLDLSTSQQSRLVVNYWQLASQALRNNEG